MNGKGIPIIAASFAVVLMALAAGYCVLQTYDPPSSASPPLVPEVRRFPLHLHASSAGEETIHHWMPATLVVNAGDTVILQVTNSDPDGAHGFVLAAFNIAERSIAPGESVTFRFKATRPGIYHYGCDLVGCAPDHAGQIGQLIVLGSR